MNGVNFQHGMHKSIYKVVGDKNLELVWSLIIMNRHLRWDDLGSFFPFLYIEHCTINAKINVLWSDLAWLINSNVNSEILIRFCHPEIYIAIGIEYHLI